jgi:hypothetical protein
VIVDMSTDSRLPNWLFLLLSWIVSVYFLTGFIREVGIPPRPSISASSAVYLGLWLLFLFLPFFKRVKLGKLLELEREVERARSELSDFKSEVRTSLSVISTNVNTIGNQSNQITVNVPGLAELERSRRDLDERSPARTTSEAKEIRDELVMDGEDTVMALARTRIRIEYLLRKILGKRTSGEIPRERAIKYLTLQQMFTLLVDHHEEYVKLQQPFTYLIQVCNAAIHAQRISAAQAEEALDIGARIIAILTDISERGEEESETPPPQ